MTFSLRFYSRIVVVTLLSVTTFFIATGSLHAATLPEKLAGQILLQVESKGEAWYVDSLKKERWYLGRPADALTVMRKLGLGISNANLVKIPRAKTNDLGNAKFTKRFLGRILLQVEELGQAWYLHPKEQRRYYLGRPADAFYVMKQVGVGITNTNLEAIPIASGSAPLIVVPLPPTPPVVTTPSPALTTPPMDIGVVGASPEPPPSTQPSPAPAPSPSPQPSTTTSQNQETVRIEMRSHMNAERSSKNVLQLTENTAMHTAAQRLTDDMFARNYFAVKTPEGLGARELLKEAGYDSRAVGILIAGGPADAATAFSLWKNSASSADLIVRADYEEIGVGFTKGNGDNLWVLLLASSQTKYEQEIAVALADLTAIRQAMLTRVNAERAKEGLPALIENELLHQSAQKKSEEMLTRDYFAHENPDGVTPHQLITSTGYPARISAENLAKGPKGVDEVMTGWMNSPGHRANILLNGIEEAGFGLKFGRNASGFNLYWTQHFGKR